MNSTLTFMFLLSLWVSKKAKNNAYNDIVTQKRKNQDFEKSPQILSLLQ